LEKIQLKPGHLYLESCPQYFYLNKALFNKSDGYKYLLAPPLRSAESIELIKRHFDKLNTIGTDHCPFLLEEKSRYTSIEHIPKGIGSLSLTFPLMYELFGLSCLPKMTSEPAEIFGLTSKGYIKEGYDADFAIVNHSDVTDPKLLYGKCDYPIYTEHLHSKVVHTVLRGQLIVENSQFKTAKGKYVRRSYEGNN
jgi:dihydropyrimidinase